MWTYTTLSSFTLTGIHQQELRKLGLCKPSSEGFSTIFILVFGGLHHTTPSLCVKLPQWVPSVLQANLAFPWQLMYLDLELLQRSL